MISKKLFLKGLNQDDASAIVDPSEYLNASNIRFTSSDSGKVGEISNVEGTTLKASTINSIGGVIPFVLPTGINQTIGAYEDGSKRRMFWFNYNSSGFHGIYCYDADDDLIYTVLDYTQFNLNFSETKFIHSVAMIENMLYWTDDYNEPRRINVESGIKLYHPTFVTSEAAYVAPLASDVISLVRAQPVYPPAANFIVDSGGTLLDGDNYQSAYRFNYKDRETSAFSMLSKRVYVNPIEGYILFSIPFNQKIPQEVESVELAIRYESDKRYVVYKTWTKDTTDIANHNAGTTQLSYSFYDNSIGIAVDAATSIKPYDSVPTLCGALEIIKSRLFLGDVVRGYEAISSSVLAGDISGIFINQTTTNQMVAYKSGAKYRFGVVYYDYAGRYCGVNNTFDVTIPERIEVPSTFVSSVCLSIGGLFGTTGRDKIPEWATHYSIVRTKCDRTNNFVQFQTTEMRYIYKDADGVFQVQTNTSGISVYGIGLKASDLFRFGLGYTFNEGDLAVIYDGSTRYKVRVLGTYSDYIIVEFFSISTFPNGEIASYQTIADVYTPNPGDPFESFYETGQKFAISFPGQTYRSWTVRNFIIPGDVVIKQRVRDSYSYYVEVMNYNDKIWNRWFTGAGRPMFISNDKVRRNRTQIVFSNVYSYGINGLSSFEATNTSLLPIEMVAIERLVNTSKVQVDGSVLLAVGQQETASVYVGETQVFDNSGSSFLATSSGVVGNVSILRGSYGTLHPESVFEWQGTVVFFDSNKGAVVKYDVNGLFPISANKMSQYWRKVGQQVMSIAKDPSMYNVTNPNYPFRILGYVDPYNQEYLLTSPRDSMIPQNEILSDVEISSTGYNFSIAADCVLTVVAEDVPVPTPTPTPTATPTPTPTPTVVYYYYNAIDVQCDGCTPVGVATARRYTVPLVVGKYYMHPNYPTFASIYIQSVATSGTAQPYNLSSPSDTCTAACQYQ